MITREDCIKIGEIAKPHGLQGEVVVSIENDFLERYADEPVFIQLDGAPVPFFISEDGVSQRNHTSYLVKFDLVDTKDQAERLAGCDVMLEKSVLDNDDTRSLDYSVSEFIGFSVVDEISGATGTITDVADYSGNVVLTIEISGKEMLLPLSENYVSQIDLEGCKLTVSIPHELMDLN